MTEENRVPHFVEIKSWDFGPRLYKIIAAATVLTLAPLFALSQVNLFSTAACESPFVRNVCQVLDTVYVGTKILAENTGYTDNPDYVPQILETEDEIIWEQWRNEPKLKYPDGYFQIANRDELAALAALDNPENGFQNLTPSIPPVRPNPIPPPIRRPSTRRGGSTARKPVFPKRNPNVIDGDLSDDPLKDILGSADKPGEKDGTKTGDKTPNTDATASNDDKKPNPIEQKSANKSEALTEIKINKAPLYDYADLVLEKVTAKKVDLNNNFVVRMNGVVNKDGSLDTELSKFLAYDKDKHGDAAMVELAKEGIQKVGASGWLKYLADEDANRLNITFAQTPEAIIADVRSDLKDVNKAKTSASGLRGLIQGALFAHKNGINTLEEDVLRLLQAAEVTNEGQVLVIKFNIEKPIAQQIIAKRLAEYKQKKEEEARKESVDGKPSGQVRKSSTGNKAR